MGAMKRLREEWVRSQWNLTGFRAEDRPAWRRLLPESLARPRVVAVEEDLAPVVVEKPKVGWRPIDEPRTTPEPPFDATPAPEPAPAPTFYRVEFGPKKPPATNQSELF